jgi:hypothetical protein
MTAADEAGRGSASVAASGPGHASVEVPVRVGFERRVSADRWAIESWRLASVERAADDEAGPRLALHRDEAEGCWLNLTTDEPSIFVQWRADGEGGAPVAIALTVSYAEAARWMDAGEQVERVPMPGEMRAWVAEFVDLHYRPEAGRRKRRGEKPSFMRGDALERMAEAERRRFGTGEDGREDEGPPGPDGRPVASSRR